MIFGCTSETHRRASDVVRAGHVPAALPAFTGVAAHRSELRARHHTSREVWHPSRDISVGVWSSRGFHTSAPSVLGFSQPFDGLLLRAASLFCFTQAPRMGFKEREQSHRGSWCVLGRALWRAAPALVATREDDSRGRSHSVEHVALCALTMRVSIGSVPASCRCVTHHRPRERSRWEEGPSTDHVGSGSIVRYTMGRCAARATPRRPNR